MSKPFRGSVKIGNEWFGVHILNETKPGWYEWRIDNEDGSSDSGVSRDEDVAVGEHPDSMNQFDPGVQWPTHNPGNFGL